MRPFSGDNEKESDLDKLSRLIFRFDLLFAGYVLYQTSLVSKVWNTIPELKTAAYPHLPKFINLGFSSALVLGFVVMLIWKEKKLEDKPFLRARLNVFAGVFLVFAMQLYHHFLLEPMAAICFRVIKS